MDNQKIMFSIETYAKSTYLLGQNQTMFTFLFLQLTAAKAGSC